MKAYKAIILGLEGVLYNYGDMVLSEETEAALRALDNEYLLAVATTDPEGRSKLKKLGLGDFFDVVIDGGNIKVSDPGSEVLRRAAKRLAVHPYETLVVACDKDSVLAARKCAFDVAELGQEASDDRALYHITSLGDIVTL